MNILRTSNNFCIHGVIKNHAIAHRKSIPLRSTRLVGLIVGSTGTILPLSWLFVIAVFFINPEAHGQEAQILFGNLKNQEMVERVLSGKEEMANAAWWGFNSKDSTKAIQGAIDSGASKVIIPYVGREWIVQPIKLASNQEIVFDPGVIVIAKRGAFKGKNDCLFSACHLSNITLKGYGAMLRMRKGDYKSRKYIKSEHRHVLEIRSSNNINVIGLRLESSGGDGIYLGYTKPAYVPCTNVLIRDCICKDNYRQGISVISVRNLIIEKCRLSNTDGTRPKAGLDLEPSTARDMLDNVVVRNCISENNAGAGFYVNISRLSKKSPKVSLLFENCYVRNCYGPGLMVLAENSTNRPEAFIQFKNCTVEETVYPGLFVRVKPDSPIKLCFTNCKWRNVATRRNKSPISLNVRRKNAIYQMGEIVFMNCHIYDEKNRPFLKISDNGVQEGIYNIKGNISVYSPYDARIDSSKIEKKTALKVDYFKMRR